MRKMKTLLIDDLRLTIGNIPPSKGAASIVGSV
jgi:hypothetical protein